MRTDAVRGSCRDRAIHTQKGAIAYGDAGQAVRRTVSELRGDFDTNEAAAAL